jgi:hypothetical protein
MLTSVYATCDVHACTLTGYSHACTVCGFIWQASAPCGQAVHRVIHNDLVSG